MPLKAIKRRQTEDQFQQHNLDLGNLIHDDHIMLTDSKNHHSILGIAVAPDSHIELDSNPFGSGGFYNQNSRFKSSTYHQQFSVYNNPNIDGKIPEQEQHSAEIRRERCNSGISAIT